MPSIHFDIPKQKVKLRAEFLYDMAEGHGTYRDVEIISISSYPGHAPTFTALIEGRYLFHYLPINAFVSRPCPPMSLEGACYFNCTTTEIGVSVLNVPEDCEVYDKNKDFQDGGKYVMTFDWFEENQLCHMVLLETGHYVLVPSHKLIFGSMDSDGILPTFKKLHSNWKV